jgi:hypothetical protein
VLPLGGVERREHETNKKKEICSEGSKIDGMHDRSFL